MNDWRMPDHDLDVAHVPGPGTRSDDWERQLQLLTLCLELQLDLLLVALRPGSPPEPGGPRWSGETLDLTGTEPVRSEAGVVHRPDWLAERYAAVGDVIEEILANPEVRRHPAVVSRLLQARASCRTQRAGLPAGGARSQDRPGALIEAGHYLG